MSERNSPLSAVKTETVLPPQKAAMPIRAGISPFGRASVDQLQRSVGNQALHRILDSARLHTDRSAAALAGRHHARAVTIGSDIYFGAGEYPLNTARGQRLLVHELTHVLQNSLGRAGASRVSTPTDAAEIEARENETAAITGAPIKADAPPVTVALLQPDQTPATLQAGDRIRVRVTMAESGDALADPDGVVLEVASDGSVTFDMFAAHIVVVGLDAELARERIAAELSRRAHLPLTVTVSALRIAGHDLAPTPSGAATDREARDRARDQFRTYISIVHEPIAAINRYNQWVLDHANSPELLTVTPPALWSQSLQTPAAAPDQWRDRRALYLRFIEDLQARNQLLTGPDLDRAREATTRFLTWYESHTDSPLLLTRDPGVVYGGFSAGATIADINRRVEQDLATRRRAREDSPAETEARADHYMAFRRVALGLLGESSQVYPYTIPVPSQGRDILVTGDPGRQLVLNAMARDLMHWADQHILDDAFVTMEPSQILLRLLNNGYTTQLNEASHLPLTHESIDRHELIWSEVLSTFGETVGKGLLVLAVFGLAVGLGVPGLLAAGVLAAIAALAAVVSYRNRRDEIERSAYQVPVEMSILHSAGDVLGVSQVIEGITGERLGTGERLSSVQQSQELGGGSGNLLLLFIGSRAYQLGRGVAQGPRPPGTVPSSPGSAMSDPAPTNTAPSTPPQNPPYLSIVRNAPADVPTPVRPPAPPVASIPPPEPSNVVPLRQPVPPPATPPPAVTTSPATPGRANVSGTSALMVETAPGIEPMPVAPARPLPHLVPAPEPVPVPESALPPIRAATPSSPTSTSPTQAPVPMVVPAPQPQPQPTNQCPPGTIPINWPAPIWATLGINDTGALSPAYNRPPLPVITKQRSLPRNQTIVDQYRADPINVAALANAAALGYGPVQVHHKWPLFLGGPDRKENFVFLPDSHTGSPHYNWHLMLYSTHYTVRGPDYVGTQYCVL